MTPNQGWRFLCLQFPVSTAASLMLGVLVHSAPALGQTGRCVLYCDAPRTSYQRPAYEPEEEYVPPTPQISPAEQARRQQRAAAVAQNQQGVAHFSKNNWQAAIAAFQKALKLSPNDPVIRRNLANAMANWVNERATRANESGNRLFEQGNYSSAVQAYQEALRLAPADAVMRKNLNQAIAGDESRKGDAADARGDAKSAIDHYRRALAAAPDDSMLKYKYDNAIKYSGVRPELNNSVKALIGNLRDAVAETPDANQRSTSSAAPPASPPLTFATGDLAKPPAPTSSAATGQTSDVTSTRFFGAESNPGNPQLDPLPPTGTNTPTGGAQSQARSAGHTAGTGATMDGSRGRGEGGEGPVLTFKKTDTAPAKRWSDLQMARLKSSKQGQQILLEETARLEELQQSNARIAQIKTKLLQAKGNEKKKLTEEWTTELNSQSPINSRLDELKQEAGKLLVQYR